MRERSDFSKGWIVSPPCYLKPQPLSLKKERGDLKAPDSHLIPLTFICILSIYITKIYNNRLLIYNHSK
jgi:hypothetical protein